MARRRHPANRTRCARSEISAKSPAEPAAPTLAALQSEPRWQAAGQVAREIRAACLRAGADAGCVLADLLAQESWVDVPPSAWKVLVRLVEEWQARGERGRSLYSIEKELSGKLERSGRYRVAKTKKYTDVLELVRQLAAVGNKPDAIQEELLKSRGIKRAVKTIRNDLTFIRKHHRP
jgi:hypothetical protein